MDVWTKKKAASQIARLQQQLRNAIEYAGLKHRSGSDPSQELRLPTYPIDPMAPRAKAPKGAKQMDGYAYQWEKKGSLPKALASIDDEWNTEVVHEEVTGPVGSRRIDGVMLRVYRSVGKPYRYYASNIMLEGMSDS